MEQVIVLPPGEWDPKIRLEPPGKVQSQVCFFTYAGRTIFLSQLTGPFRQSLEKLGKNREVAIEIVLFVGFTYNSAQ